jgi:hypothetical protein
MWAVAFLALATRYGVGPLVLIKPTFFIFAAVGIRTRAWWLTLVLGVAFALVTISMWFDYLTVMRNVVEPDPTYPIWTIPMMLVPLIARWQTTIPRPDRSASAATATAAEEADAAGAPDPADARATQTA